MILQWKILGRLVDMWAVFRGRPTSGELAVQEQLVSLRKEIGELALELAEARDHADAQRARLEELARMEKTASGGDLSNLFSRLAAPLSQLRMQAFLLESGKEISGRSVMALAAQVAHQLESAGLEPIAANGQLIPFDPRTCEPMVSGKSFQEGVMVTVRCIGYKYRGIILRKAIIDEP